jgi:hypothetical protein
LNGASKSIDSFSKIGSFVMERILGVCVWKCEFAKSESDIRENHDLQTHLKRKRDITDNFNRIWMSKSWGRNRVSFFSMSLWVFIFVLVHYDKPTKQWNWITI